MYLIGKGHRHTGPGTSMTQFIDWTQAQENMMSGLGRCPGYGMGCGCGGHCQSGLGLFESGLDWSGWGIGEWSLVMFGAYVATSLVFTTSRATRAVRAIPGERRKRKAARLREQAKQLSKKR